jgi:hypothetical protein
LAIFVYCLAGRLPDAGGDLSGLVLPAGKILEMSEGALLLIAAAEAVGLIHLLVYILILALIIYLFFWGLSFIPLPDPIRIVITVVVAIVLLLILVNHLGLL